MAGCRKGMRRLWWVSRVEVESINIAECVKAREKVENSVPQKTTTPEAGARK
jgi:hypothetical protein